MDIDFNTVYCTSFSSDYALCMGSGGGPGGSALGTNARFCCIELCNWDLIDWTFNWIFAWCPPPSATDCACTIGCDCAKIPVGLEDLVNNLDESWGEWGTQWQDDDGDNIPNILDAFPTGWRPGLRPLEEGDFNPMGILPWSMMQHGSNIDAFVDAMGITAADLGGMTGVEDLNGDGSIQAIELVAAIESYLGEQVDALETKIENNDYFSGVMSPEDIMDGFDELVDDFNFVKGIAEAFVGLANGFTAADRSTFGIDESLVGVGQLIGALGERIEYTEETIKILGGALAISVTEFVTAFARRFGLDIPSPVAAPRMLDDAGVPVDMGDGTEAPPEPPPPVASEVGDPVSTANGGFVYEKVDLQVAGRGMPLEIRRHYNSRSRRRGTVGAGWSVPLLETHLAVWGSGTAGRVLHIAWGDGNTSFFHRPDGAADALFVGVGDELGKVRIDLGEYADSCEIYPGLTPGPDHMRGFVYRSPSGHEFHFCFPVLYAGTPYKISWLKKVVDPSGNAIVFHRDDMGQVTQIVDTLQRSYQLTYDDEHFLLRKIIDPSGREIDYSYDFDFYDPESEEPPRFDLVEVTYADTKHLAPNGAVSMGRPSEGYSYWENPNGGYVANPDPWLNHNLQAIYPNNGPASVTIDYYETVGDYEVDKVKSHTVDGQITNYSYLQLGDGSDPDQLQHETKVHFPDGEVEIYQHDGHGLLKQREVWNGLYDSGGMLIPGTQDPDGPSQAWITTYDYNDSFRVTEVLQTTNDLIGGGAGRARIFAYDDANTDRFRHGNILSITEIPDGLNHGEPASRTSSYLYDPVVNDVRQSTDVIGRIESFTFGHQELAYDDIEMLPTVAGWGILPDDPNDETYWSGSDTGLGDVNLDGVAGGTHQIVRRQMPEVDVADPSGPAGGTHSVTPIQLLQYNSRGQLSGFQDTEGVWTEAQYDQGNPVTVTVDPGGLDLVRTMTYDGLGRLVEAIAPDGIARRTTYDARNLILEEEIEFDPSSPGGQATGGGPSPRIITQFFYDLEGRSVGHKGAFEAPASGETYPLAAVPNLERVATYSPSGSIIALEERVYDPNGNLQHSGLWSVVRDGRRRIVHTTTPLGAEFDTVLNSRGDVVQIERFDDQGAARGSFSYGHNLYGDVTSIVRPVDSDGDGTLDTTVLEIDGYGRVATEVDPEGTRYTFGYDSADRIEQIDADLGGVPVFSQSLVLDAQDRVVSTSVANLRLNPDGTVTQLSPASIDAAYGHGIRQGILLWSVMDPGGRAYLTRNEHDAIGRLVASWRGSSDEVGVAYTFDPAGRVRTRRVIHDDNGSAGPANPSESVWTMQYDGLGRLTHVVDPVGSTTDHTYTARGQVAETSDPVGTIRQMAYNSAGDLLSTTETGADGLSRTISYEYDVAGNNVAMIDGEGRRTEYDHDSLGQATARRFHDQSAITFQYDDGGRMTQVDAPGGVVRMFGYDGRGALVSTLAGGAGAAVVQTLDYDALGNPFKATDRVGGGITVVTHRSYSSLGQLSKESHVLLGRSYSMEFDGASGIKEVQYPSGLIVEPQYDGIGRLVGIEDDQGNPFVTFAPYGMAGYRQSWQASGTYGVLERDAAGKVTRKELRMGGSSISGGDYALDAGSRLLSRTRAGDGRVEEFGYDGLNRLSSWTFDALSGSPRDVSWLHDDVDNPLLYRDGALTVIPDINVLNQMTAFGPIYPQIDYEPGGAESSRQVPSGGTVDRTWDSLGRPVSTLAADGRTISYLHDGFGRMIARSDSLGNSRTYEYFGRTLLGSNDSGAGLMQYAWAHGELAARFRGAEELYFHVDPRGNVEALHNTSAGVFEFYDCDPYGKPRDAVSGSYITASALANDLFFVQAPYDFVTGTYQMLFRQYDPVTGRFLSRDPLAEAGGINLYGYGAGNPMSFSDASGLTIEEASTPADDIMSPLPPEAFESGIPPGLAGLRTGGPSGPDPSKATPMLDNVEWAQHIFELDDTNKIEAYGEKLLDEAANYYWNYGTGLDGLSEEEKELTIQWTLEELGTVLNHAASEGDSTRVRANMNAIQGVGTFVWKEEWREGVAELNAFALNAMSILAAPVSIVGGGARAGISRAAATTANGARSGAPKGLPAVVRWVGRVVNYKNKSGGPMTPIEHIFLRHGPSSTSGAGTFAQGTRARDVVNMVRTAAREGRVTFSSSGRGSITHDFGRSIGTARGGGTATRLQVYLNEVGEVMTAFPIR